MAYQPTDHDEALARLSLHEFLVEVLYAELFASLTSEHATRFKERLRDRFTRAYGRISGDPIRIAQMQWLQGRSVEMMDRLLAKVAERERDLREGRKSPVDATSTK